jgi:hypothetical protein
MEPYQSIYCAFEKFGHKPNIHSFSNGSSQGRQGQCLNCSSKLSYIFSAVLMADSSSKFSWMPISIYCLVDGILITNINSGGSTSSNHQAEFYCRKIRSFF